MTRCNSSAPRVAATRGGGFGDRDRALARRSNLEMALVNELEEAQNHPLTVWAQRLEHFRRMRLELGVEEPIAITDLEPEGNFLWMVEINQWRSALDLMGGNGLLTCALASHFDDVTYLDPRAPMEAFARCRLDADGIRNVILGQGDPTSLPYENGSFDFVAAQDVLDALLSVRARSAPHALLRAVLAECRRVLRPGGGLYLRVANSHHFAILQGSTSLARRPHSPNNQSSRAAVSPRSLMQSLGAAGFRDVRLYYVEPFREWPLALIPATRTAVRVYESRGHFVSLLGRVRRSMARAGFHSRLYSALVALAYL